jgi:hypothetical protein
MVGSSHITETKKVPEGYITAQWEPNLVVEF